MIFTGLFRIPKSFFFSCLKFSHKIQTSVSPKHDLPNYGLFLCASLNSSNKPIQQINVIIRKNQSQYQLVNFYHGSLCSLAIKTLKQAINNDHLLSLPAINKLNFEKYIFDKKINTYGTFTLWRWINYRWKA